MPTADEVLAQIDAAVDDWTVSGDAMRCTPDPTPEPAVPAVPVVSLPDLAVARARLVSRLVEYHDLTAAAARRAVVAAEAGRHTEHTGLVHAEARAVMARHAHEAGDAIAAFLQAMRPALQAMAEAARRAGDAFATADCAKACPVPTRSTDRPAWQSPYGPPSRRRR